MKILSMYMYPVIGFNPWRILEGPAERQVLIKDETTPWSLYEDVRYLDSIIALYEETL